MCRVIVIDDQATSRLVLEKIVQSVDATLDVVVCASGDEALALVRTGAPDLILTDYKMPGMDGIEFTRLLRTIPTCRDLPVVIITSSSDASVRYRALESGATDFLQKPVDPIECRARCRNLLRMYRQQQLILDRARQLEEQVADAVQEIRVREHDTLWRLGRAAEYRDEETGNHIVRISKYSRLIGERLGLPASECQAIEIASPMHDIGKIGIPDAILLKPGRHTAEETTIMRRHSVIGYDILKGSPSKYLQLGAVIALGHHERFDGGGYPHGLAGEHIPIAARIVAVADVFDALMSIRPYKPAWPMERAVAHIRDSTGTHLDPACVASFLEQLDAVADIANRYRDEPHEVNNVGVLRATTMQDEKPLDKTGRI